MVSIGRPIAAGPAIRQHGSICEAIGGDFGMSEGARQTYSTASGLVVAALAGDFEGNIVGGVALDLNGAGREVVEVLVQQL